MTVNDNSSIINKFETSLTDDARVVIYDRHMFIIQPTGLKSIVNKFEMSLTDDARIIIYDRHIFISRGHWS